MGDTRATDSLLRGIETAKSGNKLLARLHLLQAVELAPRDPNCWLWLAWVAESPASAMHSLQRVLDEHPQHELAQLGMKWASAMADFEYQEVNAEESPAAPVAEESTVEENPIEDSPQTSASEEEANETETWEAESEDTSSDIEVAPVFETQDDELEASFETSNLENEDEQVNEDVLENSEEEEVSQREDCETEATISETTDDNGLAPIQPATTETAETDQDQDEEATSSTDWFTQDESVETNHTYEEPRFAVGEENQDETSEAAESSEFDETEEKSDTLMEQSEESPWEETIHEETVVAETQPHTEEVAEENFEAELVSDFHNDADLAASESEDVEPSQEWNPSDDALQGSESQESLQDENLDQETEEAVSPSLEGEGNSTAEALATAALAEEEMSTPEPVAEETSTLSNEVELEEKLPVQRPMDMDFGVSVLVVDDSPTVRKLVTMTLEKNGFSVGAAADGVVALKSIAELKPRLILLDITMPRLGGYQLCKLIKKHESTKHIPVIMLSGKDGMFDKVRGKFVGCDDYITKPFDPEVLVEKVSTQLTEHYGVAGTQS